MPDLNDKSQNAFSNFDMDEEDLKGKTRMQKFLDSSQVQLFVLIVTFYSLFADDYRTLTSNKTNDIVYDVFVILCMFIFTAEIVLSCFFKPGYFNSYYFYLDIISTASLILDFSPIRNALILFRYIPLTLVIQVTPDYPNLAS